MSRKEVNDGRAIGLSESQDARLESLLQIQRAFVGAVNPDGSLTPAGIKALLERYGITIRSIADQLGVTDAHIHAVITRKKHNPRVQDAIAVRLGMDSNQLWGRKVA